MSGVPDVEDAEKVVCAGKMPTFRKCEKGKDYFWCTCGRSKNQPFCDGSHAGTNFTPMKWTAPSNGNFKFCTCKGTRTAPICDNTHIRFWSLCCGSKSHVGVGDKYEKIV